MSTDAFGSSAFSHTVLHSGFNSMFLPASSGGPGVLDAALARTEAPWNDVPEGKVVHVVDRLTEHVFGSLGPTIEALADVGIEQTLLTVDTEHSRRLLSGVHESVQIVLTRDSRNAVRRWNAALGHFRAALASGPVRSIHLHGLMPAMLAPFVMRSMNVDVPAFYSPHTARISHQARAPLGPAAPRVAHFKPIDQPVDDLFLNGMRLESPRPLVLTACSVEDERTALQMSQLAVLLFDEVPAPAFAYVGSVGATSNKRLKAARVEIAELGDEFERAMRFASVTVYVALGSERGFPFALAEAMASGVPCVAIDSHSHRHMLKHGQTGLLGRSFKELLHHVAQLLHSADLRERLGNAARAEARLRFTQEAFRQSLLSAYELGSPPKRLPS